MPERMGIRLLDGRAGRCSDVREKERRRDMTSRVRAGCGRSRLAGCFCTCPASLPSRHTSRHQSRRRLSDPLLHRGNVGSGRSVSAVAGGRGPRSELGHRSSASQRHMGFSLHSERACREEVRSSTTLAGASICSRQAENTSFHFYKKPLRTLSLVGKVQRLPREHTKRFITTIFLSIAL